MKNIMRIHWYFHHTSGLFTKREYAFTSTFAFIAPSATSNGLSRKLSSSFFYFKNCSKEESCQTKSCDFNFRKRSLISHSLEFFICMKCCTHSKQIIIAIWYIGKNIKNKDILFLLVRYLHNIFKI